MSDSAFNGSTSAPPATHSPGQAMNELRQPAIFPDGPMDTWSDVDSQPAFEVPAEGIAVLDRILTRDEIRLVGAIGPEPFTMEQARSVLSGEGTPWPEGLLEPFLRSAYARGVVQLEDESFTRFRIGSFYLRLEVFALSEPEAHLALPAETRESLDSWCLREYVASLPDDVRPTSDRVLSLQDTLAVIDAADRPIWLNRCDCRTLTGHCDKPTDVCISFRNGINTLQHRGWSKPLTKDEAKAVLRKADADGLMHTANEDGICNCCSDCCYLFRAETARGTRPGVWPLAESVAALDPDLCIWCEVCLDRCPFDALTSLDGEIVQIAELCRGCGLCVETCPTDAFAMVPRSASL